MSLSWRNRLTKLSLLCLVITIVYGITASNAFAQHPLQLQGTVAHALKDQAGGEPIQASSTPKENLLYPLNKNFFVTEQGFVGIGTLLPTRELEIFDANQHAALLVRTQGSFGEVASVQLETVDTFWNIAAGSNDFGGLGGLGFRTCTPGVDDCRTRLVIDQDGRVGIRTTDPSRDLEIFDQNQNAELLVRTKGNFGQVASIQVQDPNGLWNIATGSNDFGGFGGLGIRSCTGEGASQDCNTRIAINAQGNVGIKTTDPSRDLEVFDKKQNAELAVRTDAGFGQIASLQVVSPDVGWNIATGSNDFGGPAGLGIRSCTGQGPTENCNTRIAINSEGMVSVRTLEITGGADLAEPFKVNGSSEIKPGTVVTIDPVNVGDLRISEKAYDPRVAGIVSGANGLQAGLVLKPSAKTEKDNYPVALTGRIYTWCDATHGKIEPGDLLTTSDTPGHCMKATDRDRSHGAILGKSMGKLSEGRGLVLALVNLQ